MGLFYCKSVRDVSGIILFAISLLASTVARSGDDKAGPPADPASEQKASVREAPKRPILTIEAMNVVERGTKAAACASPQTKPGPPTPDPKGTNHTLHGPGDLEVLLSVDDYNLERAQRLVPDPDEADEAPPELNRNAERAATTMRGYSPGLP